MDQKLRTERRKLADLKAAEYNPRKALTPDDAEYQKIRRSIEEFGYVDPIIINEDGTIIGGHQRATVLKDLGYQEVDVVVVALDKQREKALNIALNKITGEWDEVKLKDLLLDLDLGDYDISLTGFEQNDLTELVDKLAIEPEAVDDDFNEDEALEQAEAEPVTKLGDVWLHAVLQPDNQHVRQHAGSEPALQIQGQHHGSGRSDNQRTLRWFWKCNALVVTWSKGRHRLHRG